MNPRRVGDWALQSASGRVCAQPPAPGARYWRISVRDAAGDRRIAQTTGGTSRATAERRVLELERKLAAHSPAGAQATAGHELLDYFLTEDRPKNQAHPERRAQWSAS